MILINYDSSYFLKKYGLKNSLILFINLDKDLDNIQYKLTLNKRILQSFSHTINDLQLSKLINIIKLKQKRYGKRKIQFFLV